VCETVGWVDGRTEGGIVRCSRQILRKDLWIKIRYKPSISSIVARPCASLMATNITADEYAIAQMCAVFVGVEFSMDDENH